MWPYASVFERRLKELVHEKSSGKLYFVFEYASDGNLFTRLKAAGGGGLPEEEVRNIMWVRGLAGRVGRQGVSSWDVSVACDPRELLAKLRGVHHANSKMPACFR